MRTSAESAAEDPGASSAFLRLSFAVHGLSAAALLLAPERWPAAVAAVGLNHAAIAYGSLWPRSRLLGPNMARLPGLPPAHVALTFDDGPDPDVTPAVLDILDRHGAKASFFCIGRKVEEHPEVAALAAARGHTVENHSYSHPNSFAFRATAGLATEIQKAQEAIERATGSRPAYFRAPVGIRNPWLASCLARAGLGLVSWTRRGFDTVTRDAGVVASRLGRGLRGGDILLLHDGGSARDARGRPVVLAALPRVLDALAALSLRGVAIPRPGRSA